MSFGTILRRLAAVWCCVLLLPDLAGGETLSAPSARAVLERFVGRWETAATITHVGPPARKIVTRGQAHCEATLRGEYYEFRTETIPAGESDLQVMTFDEELGVFQQWVFSSDGYRHEATGTWNAATSTLEWKGTSPAGSFVIQDHWTNRDRLDWTLERKDAQGRTVQTIAGTVSRATGKAPPEEK